MLLKKMVEQYKIWLKNPEAVDEKTRTAFEEIYKETRNNLHVHQEENERYRIK